MQMDSFGAKKVIGPVKYIYNLNSDLTCKNKEILHEIHT